MEAPSFEEEVVKAEGESLSGGRVRWLYGDTPTGAPHGQGPIPKQPAGPLPRVTGGVEWSGGVRGG